MLIIKKVDTTCFFLNLYKTHLDYVEKKCIIILFKTVLQSFFSFAQDQSFACTIWTIPNFTKITFFFKNKQPVVFHSLIFLSPSKHILINQILFFHTGLNSASFIWVHSGKRPYQLKTVNDEVFILTFNINLKYSKCIFSIALPLKIPIFHWHSSIH